MNELIQKLTSAPFLAFPSLRKPYILETDASVGGLRIIFSQKQEDEKIHLITYARCSLSLIEKKYGIIELETLTVMCELSHIR